MGIFFLFSLALFSLVIGIIEIQNNRFSKAAVVGYLLVFLLFLTFRGLEPPDALAYADFYKAVDTSHLYLNRADLPITTDIGYGIFNQIVKFFFGSNYHFIFLIIPVFNLYLIKISFKKLFFGVFEIKNHNILYGLFFALYISYYGILYSGVVLRGGLALSFLFYSYVMGCQKKWVWAILFYFIAIKFQSSAIIGILIALILFSNSKLNKSIYFISWVVIGFLYFIKFGYFTVEYFPQIFGYLSDINTLQVFTKFNDRIPPINDMLNLKLIYFYLIGGLFLTIRQHPFFYRFLNVYYLGLLIYVLFPVSYMSRVTDIFMFSIFVLQYFFLASIESKKIKALVYSFVVVCNTIFISRVLY